VRTPKLSAHLARAQFYRYYAGYSNGFVEDILDELKLDEKALVLDPWNGSGTTTTISSLRGIDSVGFDINPAAVLLGRACLLGSDIAGSVESLAAEMCKIADTLDVESSDDPLGTWFGPSTTLAIRRLEYAVHRVLVDESAEHRVTLYDPNLPQSSLAAGFYVLLFRMVRKLVHRYVPSNPTWIKNPTGRKLGIPKRNLRESFKDEARRFVQELEAPRQLSLSHQLADGKGNVRADVNMGDSSQLPLADGEVSAVLSSPPYCTRIDYVKATLPELAVLGLSSQDIRSLRDQMIGTPTMTGHDTGHTEAEIGRAASHFIDEVATHRSRASATYYKKYYEQYFSGMARSLIEMHRVLSNDGRAVLVVQDSYYKELHLDLAKIIGDMSDAFGWRGWERYDFLAPRTMASINSASRRYRSTFRTVESALILQK
jgi:SAM-dependent methyltransferase